MNDNGTKMGICWVLAFIFGTSSNDKVNISFSLNSDLFTGWTKPGQDVQGVAVQDMTFVPLSSLSVVSGK